ncbi:MAG TPA: hypothetical protein VGF18_05465 [Candidatus Tumulicola sp.]
MADDRVAALAARVGEFHITDRAMRRAQDDFQRELTAGSADDGARARYLNAVRNYFDGFAREARGHLRDVDRRLVDLHQVQFNLTAERGVAVKRIEAAEGVLAQATQLSEAQP